MKKETSDLIVELKKFDTQEFYKKDYKVVKKLADNTINSLILKGESMIDKLYPLLESIETWSCLFTLEIFRKIKNVKTVPHLILFIEKNDDPLDYFENNEEAMNALIEIGEPAIPQLLNKVKKNLESKKECPYLIGALTGIKDERVYTFMLEIVKNYIKDYKKYDGWFDISAFIVDFDKQENKEALPILEELAKMKNLSRQERIEVEDTIAVIRDPKKYEEETKLMLNEFKNYFKGLDKLFGQTKVTNKEREEFFDRSNDPDENFETNFMCNDCKERQNIKTGLIYYIDQGKKDAYSFEHEILCKHCQSHNIELSQEGKMEILGKQMRTFIGNDKGVVSIGKKILVENKEVNYDKAYDYILNRLKEESENGELYLRAANIARKFNKYEEVIKFYEKSLEQNPKLIASYINLIEIYLHRDGYYEIKENKGKAMYYFVKLTELFNSQDYDTATIHDSEFIHNFLINSGEKLNLRVRTTKVGRNDPCPCGSGKKFKKCCLGRINKK